MPSADKEYIQWLSVGFVPCAPLVRRDAWMAVVRGWVPLPNLSELGTNVGVFGLQGVG